MSANGETNRLDPGRRWGVEYRPLTGGRWQVLGTAGTHAQAMRWLLRFWASGDFRIRSPRPSEVATHARP